MNRKYFFGLICMAIAFGLLILSFHPICNVTELTVTSIISLIGSTLFSLMEVLFFDVQSLYEMERV